MPKIKPASNRLSDEDLSRVGDAVRSALYHHLYDVVARVQSDVVDELRLAPLASELRDARARRGLDLKSAAKLLKAPQYVVRELERGKIPETGLGPIQRYADTLGIKDVFERWKSENPELVLRLGRPQSQPTLLSMIEQQVLAQVLHGVSAPVAARGPTPVRAAGSGPAQALQLKIVLEETNPAIWRRVLVTDDTTLASLHDVIQDTMGWLSSHLYLFEVDGRRYVDPELMDDPDPDDHDARKTRLSDLALATQASFSYEYDFGDGWEHRITVERIGEVDQRAAYPTCLAGARACPPEDSGGPHGYQELLEILGDPSHPEHEERTEWVGHTLSPESFAPAAVNRVLARKHRRRRK